MSGAIRTTDNKKTAPYDTSATVTRIDGDTAWVHIPGGVEETPVKMTVKAKKGDSVQVRISGGRAWITGNHTAPPTDDSAADKAMQAAKAVANGVNRLRGAVKAVSRIAGNTAQYFWHTETGTDTGVHITEIPKEEFQADPENGGWNLLARSVGLAIRNGLAEILTLSGIDGIQIGEGDEFHTNISSDSMSMSKGEDVLFHVYTDEYHSILNMGEIGKAVGCPYSNREIENYVDYYFVDDCTLKHSGSLYYLEDNTTGQTYVVEDITTSGQDTYGTVYDLSGGSYASGKYTDIIIYVAGSKYSELEAVSREDEIPEVPYNPGSFGMGGTEIVGEDGMLTFNVENGVAVNGGGISTDESVMAQDDVYATNMYATGNVSATGGISGSSASISGGVSAGNANISGAMTCGTIGSGSKNTAATNALIYRGEATQFSNNCNNITTTGIYYITGTALTNGNSATWCHLMVINAGVITQYLLRAGSINSRIFAGSPASWTNWATF